MDWLTFEGRIEAVTWGRSVYTILKLPADIAAALEAAGAKRVEGEIKEHAVNLALSRAPVVDGLFLWTGKSLLDRAEIDPGEVFEVRLRRRRRMRWNVRTIWPRRSMRPGASKPGPPSRRAAGAGCSTSSRSPRRTRRARRGSWESSTGWRLQTVAREFDGACKEARRAAPQTAKTGRKGRLLLSFD